jgi:hypothetical protein
MPLHPTFAAILSAHGWTEEEPQPEERYQLRGWVGGYRVTDRGEVIVTVHGPNFALASKIYRDLRDAADELPPTPVAA